jgi:hypothetical protein
MSSPAVRFSYDAVELPARVTRMAKRILMEQVAHPLPAGTVVVTEVSATSTGQVAPVDDEATGIIARRVAAWIGGDFLRQRYVGQAAIRAVAWTNEERGIAFWTVIDQYDPQLVDTIVAAEDQLGVRLGQLDLDYRTVFAEGKSIASVLPSSAELIE